MAVRNGVPLGTARLSYPLVLAELNAIGLGAKMRGHGLPPRPRRMASGTAAPCGSHDDDERSCAAHQHPWSVVIAAVVSSRTLPVMVMWSPLKWPQFIPEL